MYLACCSNGDKWFFPLALSGGLRTEKVDTSVDAEAETRRLFLTRSIERVHEEHQHQEPNDHKQSFDGAKGRLPFRPFDERRLPRMEPREHEDEKGADFDGQCGKRDVVWDCHRELFF